MKKLLIITVIFCILSSCKLFSQTNWGIQFSDAIISRYQPTINNMTNKSWEYSNSIVLHGIEQFYEKNKSATYLNYIKTYVDNYIGADGTNITTYLKQNLDLFHPALLCLFLYKETGEQKYKTAATLTREYINSYPRTASGGFYHKSNYPNQMWLDGIYMAEPFLVKYGFRMGDATYCNNEATFQTLLIYRHTFNPTKNILYHGWDESKAASWANPTTGVSPEVWSRALGWYAMALVDILKYLPGDHPKHDSMLLVLNQVATGIKNYQDANTGLWFQVVDKGAQAGNWTESTGSGMFVYTLKTAVNYGWIDTSYLAVARKGWAGLKSKISTYTDGLPRINGFAAAMGIKNNYNEYVSNSLIVNCPAPSGTQHPHGYCAVLMASSVMEYDIPKQFRLQIYNNDKGSVTTNTSELYQNEGALITLTATAKQGFKFSHWSGDASGSNPTIEVNMDNHKNITANFIAETTSLKGIENKKPFRCYPSATKNFTYAQWNSNTSSLAQLTLFNLNGKPLSIQKNIKNSIGDNEYMLDLTNFIPGMYLCQFSVENQTHTSRIIKL